MDTRQVKEADSTGADIQLDQAIISSQYSLEIIRRDNLTG
jgi:hypothetical protein